MNGCGIHILVIRRSWLMRYGLGWMEGIVELCLSPGSARGGGVKRIDWGKNFQSLTRTRMAKLHPEHTNSHGQN